jgi:hypothetical protein
VAGVFGFIQQQVTVRSAEHAAIEAQSQNERAAIEARSQNERAAIEARSQKEIEWGLKVVDLYMTNSEKFDVKKHPEQASRNLQMLARVAPVAVQGVLNAEISQIPAPTNAENDDARLNTLASVASVQSGIDATKSPEIVEPSLKPSAFMIYLQYPEDARATAERVQASLVQQGYRVPGMEQVRNVPLQLEVRYYRPEQRVLAEGLAGELGSALSKPSAAKIIKTSKSLPRGIMEVWLPRN